MGGVGTNVKENKHLKKAKHKRGVHMGRCNATFYSLSASSLGSKYVGESEKLVKLLFQEAKKHQPAIIFFDEIDSVLRSRQSNEEEWVSAHPFRVYLML